MRVLAVTSATVLVVGGAATGEFSGPRRTVVIPDHTLTIHDGRPVRVEDKTGEWNAQRVPPGAYGGVSNGATSPFGFPRRVSVTDATNGSTSSAPSRFSDSLLGNTNGVSIHTPLGRRTLDGDLGPLQGSSSSRRSFSRSSRQNSNGNGNDRTFGSPDEFNPTSCPEIARRYGATGFSEFTCSILMRSKQNGNGSSGYSDFAQGIIDRSSGSDSDSGTTNFTQGITNRDGSNSGSVGGGGGVSYGRNSGSFRPFSENNEGGIFSDVNYTAPSGNRPFADPPRNGDFDIVSDFDRRDRERCEGSTTQPMFDGGVFGPFPGFFYCGVFGPVPTLSEYLPRGSDR